MSNDLHSTMNNDELDGSQFKDTVKQRTQTEVPSKIVPCQIQESGVSDIKNEENHTTSMSNSYHWEEKNYSSWAKDRLCHLLAIEIRDDNRILVKPIQGTIRIVGEASTSFRKGKKVVFFEFEASFGFKATAADGSSIQGECTIKDFTSEDSDDEWRISCTVDANHQIGASIKNLKLFIEGKRAQVVTHLRRVLSEFSSELRNK